MIILQKAKISEFGKIVTGKTPSSSVEGSYGDLVPFVTPSDNFDSKFITNCERYLSETGRNSLQGKLLKKNTIFVTCIGSAMGKVAMASEPSITNQQINSIECNDFFDPNYIYYLLKNNYKLLRNASSGSTAVPILNKTDFENLEVLIFRDKNKQQKIASVLSTLDEKIDLNNQINATLEQMAKTLYDYWFVQFDFPDDNGKPYKSSGGEMVYNETLKRDIPKGWKLRTVKNYCPSTGGYAFKSTEWTDTGNPVIKIKNIQENHTLNIQDIDYVDLSNRKIDNKFKAKAGNIVIAMTGATIGKFALIPKTKNDFYLNQRVGYFDLGDTPVDRLPFLINSLNMDYFRDSIFTLASGAAQPNISNAQINNIVLLMPPSNLIEEFNSKISTNYESILNNQFANQNLIELRDWLLPILMNGQVTVQ